MVSTPGLGGHLALILTGPTAAGKSALAIAAAARVPGLEIINADSLLFYRGMDIGTAKPTREELALVPHHLIDIRDPDQPLSAGDFVRAALDALAGITARGGHALIVGGSGFYLKALRLGLWDAPPADPAVRARLEELPSPELHARLSALDPASALRLGANDRYRLVRALEIHALSGRTPSELEAESPRSPRFELWCIDRQDLPERISKRTRAMLEAGLIEEVRRLRARYPQARALGAVGYREAAAYLEGHAPTGRKLRAGLEGLQDEIELATRQLVKKQRTWFRSQSSRIDFNLPGEESKLLTAIEEFYRS